MRTDKELLDALDEMFGVGLIHDDHLHWYISDCGMQTLGHVESDEPGEFQSSFLIIGDEVQRGRRTVREAINAYLDEVDSPAPENEKGST